MGKIEMSLADLRELYTLMELYEKTYGQPGITVAELKERVKKKCEERGEAGNIKNARKAGRKKKYSKETDRKIVERHKSGKSIRKIASETGCSMGYVQKLIFEHKHKEGCSGEAEPEGKPASP